MDFSDNLCYNTESILIKLLEAVCLRKKFHKKGGTEAPFIDSVKRSLLINAKEPFWTILHPDTIPKVIPRQVVIF